MKKMLLSILLLTAGNSTIIAQPPIGWRHNGTGSFPKANPPTQWARDKNVVWKTPISKWANASPVIVGDRVFVCSEPDTLICLSRTDGRILWQKANSPDDVLPAAESAMYKKENRRATQLARKLGKLKRELRKQERKQRKKPSDQQAQAIRTALGKIEDMTRQLDPILPYVTPATHGTTGYASATPSTNGKRIGMVFATGLVVCYDMQGTLKWAVMGEKPVHQWGHSASAILIDNTLVVHVIGVTGYDIHTGKVLWRTPSKARWGSPVTTQIGNTKVVITANADILRLSDGKLIAKELSPLTYCAPIIHDNIAYFIQHKGKAVELPATEEEQPKTLWSTRPKRDRYYASPVYHKGLLYAIDQKNNWSIIDAANGNIVYTKKLKLGKGRAYPSIALAGDYLYVSHESGTTLVLEPGRAYKEVATNNLEPFRTTPVFIGNRIYIRTLKALYCIGQ